MKALNLPTRNPRPKKIKTEEVPTQVLNWQPLKIEKYPHLRTRGNGYATMLQTKIKMVTEFKEL